MKTNNLMAELRNRISPETKKEVEFLVNVANNIYQILEKKGLNQKQFAKLCGKTETEASRWLSGTHNLTTKTLAKISQALNVEIYDIVAAPKPKKIILFSTQNKLTFDTTYKCQIIPLNTSYYGNRNKYANC